MKPVAEQASMGTTNKQLELLQEIVTWISIRGYPPTVREMADLMGTAIGDIQCKLARLRRDGLVEWEERRSRTLRVTCSETRLIELLG